MLLLRFEDLEKGTPNHTAGGGAGFEPRWPGSRLWALTRDALLLLRLMPSARPEKSSANTVEGLGGWVRWTDGRK